MAKTNAEVEQSTDRSKRHGKWWYPLFGSTIRETIEDIKMIRASLKRRQKNSDASLGPNVTK